MTLPMIFMGSKGAGLRLCQFLCNVLPHGSISAIFCPDDRGDSRSVLESFQALGISKGIPVEIVPDLATTKALLLKYQPQYAFVHGWYQIIPLGGACQFFGFHYSPLPRYRGNAPVVWQIINGEPSIGVTFFRFSEGMDEGDVVAQSFVELTSDDTIADVLVQADKAMLEIARTSIPQLLEGSLELIQQDHSQASYCGMRIPEDGLIDWKQSAEKVHNFIRAQTKPYPGAYSRMLDGRVIRFWKSAIEKRQFFGVPGSIVEINEDWVVIACGLGAVRVFSINLDGEGDKNPCAVFRSFRTRLV